MRRLTCVDLLQRDVFLQLAAKLHLGTVLARGAVVSQDEVRVQAVQHSQLAQRIRHGLVWSDHLKHTRTQKELL